jgi:hypothetical protein
LNSLFFYSKEREIGRSQEESKQNASEVTDQWFATTDDTDIAHDQLIDFTPLKQHTQLLLHKHTVLNCNRRPQR